MSGEQSVTINSGTKEQVAYDLFKFVMRTFSDQKPKDTDAMLALYKKCLDTVQNNDQ